jgi:DNA-binding beta-propeller fold protein YncE
VARPRRLTALLVVAVALLIPSSASAFEPLLQFGTGAPGPGPGQLNNPAGVAVAPDGDVYVSEISNDRVSVFTPKGTFSRSFGGGHIDAPEGLAFGLDGNIYVTAVNTSLIAAFAPDGTFLRSFGGPGTGAGQIDTGGSIAVDPATGNLFVGDFFNNRIDVFTPAGGFLYAFGWDVIPGNGITVLEVCTTATGCKVGTGGGGVGQLDQPRQLAIDGIGNLFVVSETSQRVSVFSTAGGFARAFGWDVIPGGFAGLEVCTSMCQFGTFGGGAGQLGGPSGMTIDGAGGIYAVERDNDRVSQFSAQGGFIRAFGWDVIPGGTPGFEVCTATTTCKDGVPGGGFGQLGGPFFAGVDCRGSLYVADPGGSRVQKFGEPGVSDRSCLPNDFSFGKLKRNKRKGRATLTVNVPGAGALALSGKGLKPQRPGTHAVLSKSVSAAGKVKLLIKSKGRKRSKLKRTGKVKLKAHVTFTPTNGDPKSKTKGIKLRKRLTSKR